MIDKGAKSGAAREAALFAQACAIVEAMQYETEHRLERWMSQRGWQRDCDGMPRNVHRTRSVEVSMQEAIRG